MVYKLLLENYRLLCSLQQDIENKPYNISIINKDFSLDFKISTGSDMDLCREVIP